jgi:hypothetical protein
MLQILCQQHYPFNKHGVRYFTAIIFLVCTILEHRFGAAYPALLHCCARIYCKMAPLNTEISEMEQKNTFDDLAKKITRLLPGNILQLQKDLESNIRALLQSSLAKMNLVTREEFDVQEALLQRTREKLDKLEKLLQELEQKH